MESSENKQSPWDPKDLIPKMGTTSKYLSSFMRSNVEVTPFTKMLKIFRDVTINDDTKTVMLSKEFSNLQDAQDESKQESDQEDHEHMTILQLIQAKRDQEWLSTPLSQLSTIDETEARCSSSIDGTSPVLSEKLQPREYMERNRSRRLMAVTPKFGSKSTLDSVTVNKEDLDVQSILTFVSTLAAQQPRVVAGVVHIPDPKVKELEPEESPRWSLRRSHCAACSQQWKDKSDIQKIRCSGLKKGSSIGGTCSPHSSVLASARLQKAVKADYIYKTDWSSGSDIVNTSAFSGQRMIERSVLERARRRHASKTS